MKSVAALTFLIVFTIDQATAACSSRPFGESATLLASAIESRLAITGSKGIFVGTDDTSRTHYLIGGSKSTFVIRKTEGMADEVGVVLHNDESTPAELERLITLSSFVMSRLSQQPEPQIRDDIYHSLDDHGVGTWLLRWGRAAAVVNRSDEALVIKMSVLDCH